MSFIGTSINQSPTFAAIATSAISNGAGKAVKFDANGQIVLCSTLGEAAIGILIMQTPSEVAAGDSVTVQVKDICPAIAGGPFMAGDFLTVDATGKFVKATAATITVSGAVGSVSGQNYISAISLGTASASGDIVQVEIVHAGYKL
jgi:hypothetical protein